MPKARDLAGLAALGFLGYKLSQQSKGKGEDSTPTRAARPDSTETREDKDDDKGYKKDVLKAITATKEAPNYKADNQGVIPPKSSGKSAAAKQAPEAAPAVKDETTVTPSSRTTPGGGEKRVEGRKPMPSLRAVESRAASNKTDAMRNASRANVAGANRQKAMAANPEAQALEESHPEQFITPGGGFKTAANMAKNLANRGGKEVAEYSTPQLAAPAKQLTGPSKADLMARDRAAREAARQEQMLKENAANYGLNPKAPGYDAAASSLRKNIGGDDFTIMKKGGRVKMASGGMTASRRGDGIASRGKTRGKIC